MAEFNQIKAVLVKKKIDKWLTGRLTNVTIL